MSDDLKAQKDYRRLVREAARQRSRSAAAHDLMIMAQTRAHDLKLRAKGAEGSVRSLEILLLDAELALQAYESAHGCHFTDKRIIAAVEHAKTRNGRRGPR